MVARAWGGEFSAPDHRVYCFGGARCFDSTDLGTTGIYQRGLSTATAPVLSGSLIGPSEIDLSWTASSVYGSEIDFYYLYKQVDGGPFVLLAKFEEEGGANDALFYRDFVVASGHTYDYFVVATPCVGNNATSNTVEITTVAPPSCTQHLIQAGTGFSLPGASGVAGPFIGWFGTNDGAPGPGFFGSTVSGQGLFLPGGIYGYADSPGGAVRVPTGGPLFIVYTGNAVNKTNFVSVTINGTTTYFTASVPYFDNAGGCGPTYWIWPGQPAGLVDGQQYCVTWAIGS